MAHRSESQISRGGRPAPRLTERNSQSSAGHALLMFFESGGQSLVELNRLGQGIEERLGILAVQAHDFVRVNGLFSMRQSTGQDKTTDRFSLETRGTFQYLLNAVFQPQLNRSEERRVGKECVST